MSFFDDDDSSVGGKKRKFSSRDNEDDDDDDDEMPSVQIMQSNQSKQSKQSNQSNQSKQSKQSKSQGQSQEQGQRPLLTARTLTKMSESVNFPLASGQGQGQGQQHQHQHQHKHQHKHQHNQHQQYPAHAPKPQPEVEQDDDGDDEEDNEEEDTEEEQVREVAPRPPPSRVPLKPATINLLPFAPSLQTGRPPKSSPSVRFGASSSGTATQLSSVPLAPSSSSSLSASLTPNKPSRSEVSSTSNQQRRASQRCDLQTFDTTGSGLAATAKSSQDFKTQQAVAQRGTDLSSQKLALAVSKLYQSDAMVSCAMRQLNLQSRLITMSASMPAAKEAAALFSVLQSNE